MDSLPAGYVDELMAFREARANREHEQAEAERMKREQEKREAELRAQLGG